MLETKHIALALMLVQNSGFVLVMRYSRQQQAGGASVEQYNPSVVVVFQELFKLVFCLVGTALQEGPAAAVDTLAETAEAARVFIPGVCFTLQNNVLYVALSNLEPLLFQITYQIKTLLTALLSIRLLGRSFSTWQWVSQLMLTAGVVLAQLNEKPQAAHSQSQNLLVGLAAVVAAAASSSYASVYFERLLKEKSPRQNDAQKLVEVARPSSLYRRNVHLCMWTVPLNAVLALGGEMLAGGGRDPLVLLTQPLRGFEASTWLLIVVNGLGGLLVAIVMKYADNILKGFATAGAIILTGALAPLLGLSPAPSLLLLLGGVLVICSLALYTAPPPSSTLLPQRTV